MPVDARDSRSTSATTCRSSGRARGSMARGSPSASTPTSACAAKTAVDGMVALMGREHGLGADDALALASVVVDLRVTQVVNEQLGVHARAARRRLEMNAERLRLWLERDRRGAGYHLRDAATGERVELGGPPRPRRAGCRRLVPARGGRRLELRSRAPPGARAGAGERARPAAVAVWNEDRTLQAGYVPRETAAGARRRRAGGLALARGRGPARADRPRRLLGRPSPR